MESQNNILQCKIALQYIISPNDSEKLQPSLCVRGTTENQQWTPVIFMPSGSMTLKQAQFCHGNYCMGSVKTVYCDSHIKRETTSEHDPETLP